jgi:hypothetical protein
LPMQLTNLLRDRHPSLRRRRITPRLHGKFSNATHQILSLSQGLVGHCDSRGPELNIPGPLIVIRKRGLLKDDLPKNAGVIGRFGDTLLGCNLLLHTYDTFFDVLQAPCRRAIQLLIRDSHGQAPSSGFFSSCGLSSFSRQSGQRNKQDKPHELNKPTHRLIDRMV